VQLEVAMAVCDGARHLRPQLRSLAEQTRLPDRLIVRDDASRDGSLRLLEAFAERAPFPVTVIRGDRRLGSTRAFEQVLTESGADYVALCDQDDTWSPGKLARLEQAFAAPDGPGLTFSDATMVAVDGRALHPSLWQRFGAPVPVDFSPQELLRRSLVSPFIPGCTLAVGRRVLEITLPFPPELKGAAPPLQHDAWLVAMASASAPVSALAEPLVNYRVHHAQQVGAPASPLRRSIDAARQRGDEVARRRTRRITAAELVREAVASSCKGQQAQQCLELLDELLAHLAVRELIANSGPRGLALAADELRSGRYRRFSSGLRSVLLDLL
jgi:glycosyltransferase involved in cell wall biosynthesis